MFKKMILAFAGITIFTVVPTLAGPPSCKNVKFHGSYTRSADTDIFLDQTVIHKLVYQLELRSDGTATQFWTGFPDYMVNTGTGTASVGSWTCRSDGKLLVTLLAASYEPVGPGTHDWAPAPDNRLNSHIRYTYLFSVDDENTLRRVSARSRFYSPLEDPTDPAAGRISNRLSTAELVYKRLVPSDADLLAPEVLP